FSGKAGPGGNGSIGDGGKGGAAGDQGGGGGGGTVDMTGFSLSITRLGALTANGGSNGTHPILGKPDPGYNCTSGDGANGGGGGSGGDGGPVGLAASAGNGGIIALNIPGAITVEQRALNGADSIAARGGLVSDDMAISGKGGNAGPNGTPGSKGGDG